MDFPAHVLPVQYTNLGLIALEPMSLIDDEYSPVNGPQASRVNRHKLVRSKQHIEFNGTGFDAACSGPTHRSFFEGHLVLANNRT